MSDDLEQLKELIDSIEHSEKTSELITWMKEISEKEYGLIDSLIECFMECASDIQFCNSILRALQILNVYCTDLVLPQLRDNTSFPKAISKYMLTTKKADLEGSGFILLIEIFKASTFHNIANDQFINFLFNSLEIIKEERIFLAVVNILIGISYEIEDPEENAVLKYCSKHANSRYFAESTLILLNKGKVEFVEKCLKFISDIFTCDDTRDTFFYSNDLFTLLDIIIREFANNDNADVKLGYLTALGGLMSTATYQKTKPRMSDIQELVSEIEYSDDVDYRISETVKAMQEAELFM